MPDCGTLLFAKRCVGTGRRTDIVLLTSNLDADIGKMSEHALHALIGDIYDAATLPEMPMSILEDAARLTGSTSATFDLGLGGRFADGGIYGADPAGRAIANDFFDQNLFLQRHHLFRPGRAELGRHFVGMHELIGTPFLHDFLMPVGTVHLLAAVFLNDGDSLGTLSLWRGFDREPHGEEERQMGDLIARHLRRAFQFGLHFREVAARTTRMESAIDMLSSGCMLLDARGRLIHANREAMNILAEADPLKIARGKVRSTSPTDNWKWQRLLARLNPGGEAVGGSAVVLGQPNAGLIIHAIPLRPAQAEVWGVPLGAEPLGLALILRWCHEPPTSASLLGTAFGLTATEADLAAALAGGKSLRDYGDRRNRSLNTVRTHLKAVFAKTGVTRQSQLVRLLTEFSTVKWEN